MHQKMKQRVVKALALVPLVFFAGCGQGDGNKIADEIAHEIHGYYFDGAELPPVLSEVMPQIDDGSMKDDPTVTLISTGSVAFRGDRMPAAIVKVEMKYLVQGRAQMKCMLVGQGDSTVTEEHFMGEADCGASMDEWEKGMLWQD